MSGQDGRSEDEAWRAIVENYGERPQVEDLPPAGPTTDREPVREPEPGSEPESEPGFDPEPFNPTYEEIDARIERAERFVPPVPPPGPGLRLPQHLPWLLVFGSPLVLLVSLLAGIALPTWLGYLLITGFVGGFCYLVLTMRRGPRPPWDDGARV